MMVIKLYPKLKKGLLALATLLLAAPAAEAQYCTPVAAVLGNCGTGSGFTMRINGVSTTGALTNISNSNATCATGGYTYYSGTGNTCIANAGTTVSCTISVFQHNQSSYPYRIVAWVDWNQNDTFDNTGFNATTNPNGELMLFSPTTFSAYTYTATFPVPLSAKNGMTRMRVRAGTRNGTNPIAPPAAWDPCLASAFLYGEVEDYDFQVINPCSPPATVSYSNLTYKTATITWSKRLTAIMYEYYVSTVKSTPGNGNYFTTATSVALPDTNIPLACDTKYYVYVRSICDTAGLTQTNWDVSAWRLDSFTTNPCCDVPEVTITNINSTTAIASWTPVTSVQRYEYAIRIDTLTPQAGTITTQTSVLLQGLAPGKELYFFLRAHCSPTPFSEWGLDSFLTQPGTGIAPQGTVRDFEVQAYPNPVKDKLSLRVIHGIKAGTANIVITDITGKIITQATMESDVTDINFANQPAGMYLIRYTDDKNSRVMKVNKE